MKTQTTTKLRFGSLFSGLGCPEAAIQTTPELQERLEPVFYSELLGGKDEDGPDAHNSRCACSVLAHRLRCIPNLGDVKKAKPPRADVILHGGMCTCFSGSNRQHPGRLHPVSLLLLHAMEVCRAANARYFLLENTDALATGEHNEYLDEVVNLCRDGYGYSIISGTLDTATLGNYPVNRRRLWVIGALGRQDIVEAIHEMWPRDSVPQDPSKIDWSHYISPNKDKGLIVSRDIAVKMLADHMNGMNSELHPLVNAAFNNCATSPRDEIDGEPEGVIPVFWKRRPDGIKWYDGRCPTLQKSSWHDIGVVQYWDNRPFARMMSGDEWARLMELPEGWLNVPDPNDPMKMLDDRAKSKLVGNSMHISHPRWALTALLHAIDQCPLWPTS